jgi:hypothetical protein
MEVNLEGLAPYLVDAEIRIGGKTLYRTPALPASPRPAATQAVEGE